MLPRPALLFLFAVLLAPGATKGRATSATSNHSAIRIPQSAIAHVALLDLGATDTAARATARLAKQLAGASVEAKAGAGGAAKLTLLDRDLARAAARGVGYKGSLNLTLADARALGTAIGCDFFITGDAQTLRRSSSARPVYFESYASVFVVSARTGQLVLWDRAVAESDRPEQAEASLLEELSRRAARYAAAIQEAFAREERERFAPPADDNAGLIDLSTDEGVNSAPPLDLREPAPYRRLRPAYTEAASRAEAEATVDAEVEIGADGEVERVRIVRWAGFGLDDEVAATIRRMHFRPAERGGQPIAVRVLLRYNFRRPPPTPK